MKLDKHARTPPTEFEIETRGMAKAVDLLLELGQEHAANLLLSEIGQRIQKAIREAVTA